MARACQLSFTLAWLQEQEQALEGPVFILFTPVLHPLPTSKIEDQPEQGWTGSNQIVFPLILSKAPKWLKQPFGEGRTSQQLWVLHSEALENPATE